MIIEFGVNLGAGDVRTERIEISDEELAGKNEIEREEYLSSLVSEWVFNQIDSWYEIII